MMNILRISKAKFHSLKKLTQKKYRSEERKFLVEGEKLVQDAIDSGWQVQTLLIRQDLTEKESSAGLIRVTETNHIECFAITETELNELSDVVTAQGIVAVVSHKDYGHSFLEKKGHSIVVALDAISDPGNLGTIIRTCDWFGVDGVIISENSVELYSPKVVRATMGSVFHLPIFSGLRLPETITNLKSIGYAVFAATLDAKTSVETITIPKKTIFILGSEAHGINPAVLSLADETVMIPKYGKAESLNVGIACGVLLARARMK